MGKLTMMQRKNGHLRSLQTRQDAAAALRRVVWPIIARLRDAGETWGTIALELNEMGFLTRRGLPWTAITVKNVKYR